MTYACCDENRRAAVAAHATLNGIDWLEVLDKDAPAGSPRQRTLMVRLLKEVPAGLAAENVAIEGGERITTIGVEWVAPANAPPASATTAERQYFSQLEEPRRTLLIRTDSSGDFSSYTLRLARGKDDDRPLPDMDPRLSQVSFNFKVECPTEFDCKAETSCAEEPGSPPEIDYLAKDYSSFRRLILDRLAQLVPGWRERSAADLGVTLAELLAYAGDHLSYWQDAVGTEAYLGTCRRRTSLSRLAKLVDCIVYEGCNARVWLHLEVTGGPVSIARDEICFTTKVAGISNPVIAPGSQEEAEALEMAPEFFEPLHDATLHQAHNEMRFYTWGDDRCCLPRGSVSATLSGHFSDLKAGEVLIFKEAKGPLSGDPDDADPSHRHAVRLTSVQALDGASPLTDPLTGDQITEITWHSADALPFPLCVSSQADDEHLNTAVDDVSVALGNIILADHGRTILDEELDGPVPESRLEYPPERDAGSCGHAEPLPVPPRYRPGLLESPLTRAGTVLKATEAAGIRRTERLDFDPEASATEAMTWEMDDVIPEIRLSSTDSGASEDWQVQRDLLNCSAMDRCFVVDTEHDGSVTLRFGDDAHGRRPESGTTFKATYRKGSGLAGNVGAGAISHAVTSSAGILSVTNPMSASGGVDPESAEQVRRRAPHAFRTQERAVTPEDYAEVTGRSTGVQRAAASLRWTGSWHSVFVTVDREGGEKLDEEFAGSLKERIDRYRMAGHDLALRDPVFVSIEMDLQICVGSQYFRSSVRRGLLDALSSGFREDGTPGLFNPDNFSFGQTFYLSTVYAAARSVAGVDSAQVTRFHRQGQEDPTALLNGYMTLGRLEIPRLDNDPNFPEHGVLRIKLFGGK